MYPIRLANDEVAHEQLIDDTREGEGLQQWLQMRNAIEASTSYANNRRINENNDDESYAAEIVVLPVDVQCLLKVKSGEQLIDVNRFRMYSQ